MNPILFFEMDSSKAKMIGTPLKKNSQDFFFNFFFAQL